MMEFIAAHTLLTWLLAGVIAVVIGNIVEWWNGDSIMINDIAGQLAVCSLLGPIAFCLVCIYLITRVFSSNAVVIRGRGRCKECDARGYHKMSCSQQYKELGDA